MSEREEIRWKLSNIQNVVSTSIKEHEKERENFQSLWNDFFKQTIQGRNTMVGGIGFGILLAISLISIDALSDEYIWIVPIGIVIALVIFVAMNIFLNKHGKKYYKLDEEYQRQVLEVFGFQSWLTGYSLREDVHFDHILLLVYFTMMYTQAISYDIKMKAYEIFGTEKPNIGEFKQNYEQFKNKNMEKFDHLDITAVKRVKNFIKILES